MPAVKALVYIAAYAPDEGETLTDAGTLGGGSTDLTKHLLLRPYPGAPEGDADGYIDPDYFHELFRRLTACLGPVFGPHPERFSRSTVQFRGLRYGSPRNYPPAGPAWLK